MMRQACLVIACLLILVVPAASQDDRLIVPGQRIGKWTLSMTVDEIAKTNGPEERRGLNPQNIADQMTDLRILWWPHLGFMAATRDGRQLVYIGISEFSSYQTDKGISTTKLREAVVAAYGTPDVTSVQQGVLTTLIYDGIGLATFIDSHNLVKTIYIFRAGDAARIWKR